MVTYASGINSVMEIVNRDSWSGKGIIRATKME